MRFAGELRASHRTMAKSDGSQLTRINRTQLVESINMAKLLQRDQINHLVMKIMLLSCIKNNR